MSNMTGIGERIGFLLEEVRSRKPLIHHITNFVVMNETANATLCLGALPVMAHAKEEVEEMVRVAGALVLNIGTLTPELVDSMVLAGREANRRGVPVVLDPVGAGATLLRTEASLRLLDEVKIGVVRGNAAEIGILAGVGGEILGVESVGEVDDPEAVAGALARERSCVVAITGETDVVSDGSRLARVANGHAMLGVVTGTGCMATTAVAAFAAVEPDAFIATVGGLVAFGLAGERAAAVAGSRPGSFHVALYDALAALSAEDMSCDAKVEIGDATASLRD